MKRATSQPEGHLVLYGGIFLKTWIVRCAGTLSPQHAHEYDHLTYLVQGIARIWRGTEMLGDFHAPAAIKIPAREKHQFLALSDNLIFACIHAVGEADDVAIHEEHHLELEN